MSVCRAETYMVCYIFQINLQQTKRPGRNCQLFYFMIFVLWIWRPKRICTGPYASIFALLESNVRFSGT